MFAGMAIGFNLLTVPSRPRLRLCAASPGVHPDRRRHRRRYHRHAVALTVSPQLAPRTLVVVLIVEQMVDSVIEPIVMGDAVRLHPLAILFCQRSAVRSPGISA